MGANDIGYLDAMEEVVDNIGELVTTLENLHPLAQVFACDILPRQQWTRKVQLHNAHPNKCAANTNDRLIMALDYKIAQVRSLT